jgi:hypothetical protein
MGNIDDSNNLSVKTGLCEAQSPQLKTRVGDLEEKSVEKESSFQTQITLSSNATSLSHLTLDTANGSIVQFNSSIGHSEIETSTNPDPNPEYELPPVDGGKQAWSYIAGTFIAEIMIHGISL